MTQCSNDGDVEPKGEKLSPFSVLMYSSNPDDIAEIQRKKSAGLTHKEAIEKILEDRGGTG
ncbi:hypothetical protein J7S78_13885 [Klebsiella oxytoca]|uniref:Uncharacterized protein n=1 Tax=Klebsiella oxytoca TaxID=571 RepID=A0AAP2FLP7_KLEOX|nr:hypothetical protein [Klebsiella oxytoca]MBQ0600884.1 hypothetical protein [Klebsiella oxytoca]